MLIPRTRGAVSGAALVLLGLVGALIPLVGPYFDFTVGSTDAWDLTEGHVVLSVLPGAAVVLGGLALLASAHRAIAGFGAWLALLGGAWFVVGDQVSRLWNDGTSLATPAAGGTSQQVAERLVYFTGLGALIVAFAAFAMGRLAVRSVRDAELAEAAAVDDVDGDDRTVVAPRETGRFERTPEREPVAVGAGDGTRTDTLSAADRVREASDGESRRIRWNPFRR